MSDPFKVLMFAAFIVIGGALAFSSLRALVAAGVARRTWHRVPGHVVDARYDHVDSTDRYATVVSYEVAYDFPVGVRHSTRTSPSTEYRTFAPGTVVPVYVNPQDPTDGVVLDGWHGETGQQWFTLAIGSAFLFAGLLASTLTLLF